MNRALLPALATLLSLAAGPLQSATPVRIAEWRVIGPFEAGSREALVDPLALPDGALPAADDSRTWPSALADGGRVAWRAVAGERDDTGALTGAVKLDLTGVAWEAREDEWGVAGIVNVAVATGVFVLESDALLLVEGARCAGTVNGQPFMGDPHAAGIARSVIRGRRGANEVRLLSGGFGPTRGFAFRAEVLDPNGPPVQLVTEDLQLPDVIAGEAGTGHAAVPVLNLTDTWLPVQVAIDGAGLSGRSRATVLAPLAPLKIPVPVAWVAPPDGATTVSVAVSAAGVTARAEASVRAPAAPHHVTFLSRTDGSAQHYGVRPATGDPAPGAKGLIISTHGAGVGALGQVGAYGPKPDLTIVAPTNRRPFGFDWHDWGRLDFEEVLDLAIARFGPDPRRVHLTGHSMGGHGAWILGCLYADRFASVAPAAAWASYDTYVPFTTRRSTWLASPELGALLLRGLASGRVSPLLENLRDVPVQILHGGKDDNVPPTQARMLAGLLERQGGSPRLVEAPEEKHWSDLDLDREGADAVDPAIMDAFWSSALRPAWPRRVTLVTPDLDVDDDRAWVRVFEADTSASEVRFEAEVVDHARIVASTRNVASFGLSLAPDLGLHPDVTVEVNGWPCAVRLQPGGVSEFVFTRGRQGWRARPVTGFPPRPAPDARPGGLAKALFTPFALVLPTQGDPARCEAMAALGRFIATAWWVRGNGLAPMVRDVDVDGALVASRSLVLLGGPELNAHARRVAPHLFVRASADGVTVQGRRIRGETLASAHWQPSPGSANRRVLVLQATSPEADALLAGLQPIAAGAGYPDFVVASPRVRVAGFGGFEAAGFWSPAWGLDPASSWFAREASPVSGRRVPARR